MQQFVVPQFIDVEDKIFGPITTRQFLILLVAGVIIFLAYRYGDFALFLFFLTIIGGLALVFAFVKVNGQTFHYFLLNIIQTLRRPGLRTWHRQLSNDELNLSRRVSDESEVVVAEPKKNVRARHIRDLALIVNTGGYYHPDDTV